jgi:uncharacterized protein YndB with AHSA1/START domain
MTADRRKETLTLVREIPATPEQVFRALTDPEELMKWWGAKGTMTGAHVNLRPGGEYRFEFMSPRGETAWVKGQYQVVEPPRRLVKTWFNSKFPDLRNSVEIRLEPAPGGTRLTLVHGGLAGRLEAFEDYEKGWPDVLGHLLVWATAFAGFIATNRPDSKES